MPSRFELESGEDVGKRESAECFVRFGSSDSALGHCDASPSELGVDDNILVWVQALRCFLTESEVDDDIGKR